VLLLLLLELSLQRLALLKRGLAKKWLWLSLKSCQLLAAQRCMLSFGWEKRWGESLLMLVLGRWCGEDTTTAALIP
jgi:hypothetical protein